MESSAKASDTKKIPKRRWLGYLCSQCGSHELIWQRPEYWVLITEILMLEGNAHPILYGEHLTGSKRDRYSNVERCQEWSCAGCGRALEDSEGTNPSCIEEVVQILAARQYAEFPRTNTATDLRSPEAMELLFGTHRKTEEGDTDQDLRCPKCGHDVFIEMEDALLSTPITMVQGNLTWLQHEKLLVNHWDKHQRFYYCANCDFEAPEPFDEWVEAGCPEDVEDWLEP